MRYIVRKFIDANSVLEALAKASEAPIHDCYLKEGEEPRSSKSEPRDLIGFTAPENGMFEGTFVGEPCAKKK